MLLSLKTLNCIAGTFTFALEDYLLKFWYQYGKLNFLQIHVVYLPKLGSISKPDLNARSIFEMKYYAVC